MPLVRTGNDGEDVIYPAVGEGEGAPQKDIQELDPEECTGTLQKVWIKAFLESDVSV